MAGKAFAPGSHNNTSCEVNSSALDGLVEFAKSSQKEGLLLLSGKRKLGNNLGGVVNTSLEGDRVHGATEGGSTILLVGTGLGLMSLK